MKSILVITAAVMAFASAASAATFSFTGSNPANSSSKEFIVDGITLTVTAGTFTGSNPRTIDYSTRRVDQDPNGLGANAGSDSSDLVDGRGGNDILIFSFSESVIIDTVRFGAVNANGSDDFVFGTVSGTQFSQFGSRRQVSTPLDMSSLFTDNQLTGVAFGFGAIQNNDNFTISRLVVSAADGLAGPGGAPVVPLPASGLMLLGGLALAGGVARRRKRA